MRERGRALPTRRRGATAGARAAGLAPARGSSRQAGGEQGRRQRGRRGATSVGPSRGDCRGFRRPGQAPPGDRPSPPVIHPCQRARRPGESAPWNLPPTGKRSSRTTRARASSATPRRSATSSAAPPPRPARRVAPSTPRARPAWRSSSPCCPISPSTPAWGCSPRPATYRAYVRYSNGSGLHQHDRKGDVRGVAVKVVGVPGRKIIPGMEDAKTVDFLLIKSPATPFRDADEFVAFVRAAAQPLLGFLASSGARRRPGPGPPPPARRGPRARPYPSLATLRYSSALPIKYGPYAVHYTLAPHARPSRDARPYGDLARRERPPRRGAGRRLPPGARELRLPRPVPGQDAKRTPIEDASVEWQGEGRPFLTVARLALLQQDVPSSPRGRRVGRALRRASPSTPGTPPQTFALLAT